MTDDVIRGIGMYDFVPSQGWVGAVVLICIVCYLCTAQSIVNDRPFYGADTANCQCFVVSLLMKIVEHPTDDLRKEDATRQKMRRRKDPNNIRDRIVKRIREHGGR